MTMMPPGIQNRLLHTAGAGLSAYQQEIVLPSKVGAAAGAMELQARAQQAAGMLGEARKVVVEGNTSDHQGRTALQSTQAEMAQACSQQGRMAAIAKHRLPVGNLEALARMAGVA